MAVVCFVKLLMYIFGIDNTGSREKESTLGARGVSSEGSGFCQVFIVTQAVCVTRFDQSECVICRVIFALGKSRFQRYMW